MDSFCIKWNEFEVNIRESFKKLRKDQALFDVTLATEDGQHIQAHKMILSAGSKFFNDIFMRMNHSNLLIYLKGTSSGQLESVLDFLYNGEAAVVQEDVELFIKTGQDLQVKGFKDELAGAKVNASLLQTGDQRRMKIYGNVKYVANKQFQNQA